MKVLLLTTPVAMLIVCAGCTRSSSSSVLAQTSPGPVTVSTAKAQKRDLVDRIGLAGSLTADEQVSVYAKVPGYLKALYVDIGDHVRAGQIIAELDIPEQATALGEKRAAVVKAQAALEQARAAVDESRANAEFAQINYQRLKNIHDRDADVLPEQDVDQARASQGVASGKLKNVEAQVKVAEAAVAAAEAEVRTVETMIAYARIESPMAGVVVQRFVDRGALIQTATSSRTQAAPVVTIARTDRVRAIADVPEASAAYVHAGAPAALQIGGASVETRVTRTAGALDAASRTLRIEFDLANPTARFRPGSTVNVSLELRRLPASVTVPVAAIRTQGAERSVFVVENARAKQISVKTGLESPEWIQVVEGLHGGEEVIVASSDVLTDGTAVSVRQ